MLGIVEIDADDRVAARVLFDLDDIDAAFEELDARYLAGEAAAHAHTWSVNSGLYAGFNRHELPATTPDWIYIDHRPLVTIEANDLSASIRAIWDLTPDISIYIEAVHRLSDLGAVVTAAAYGTSQEGFDAEWRMIDLFTVEGDLISRCEIFDEADLDAALARFEELQPQAPRLENAASQVAERLRAHFAARDWDAMAENAGRRLFQSTIAVGSWARESDTVETPRSRTCGRSPTCRSREHDVDGHRDPRGAPCPQSVSASRTADQRPEAFLTEMLDIVEINADERIVASVMFDLDDIDAAFEELDARYLAGEAAAHARTWSVIAEGYAAFNRHEMPATTPDWVTSTIGRS